MAQLQHYNLGIRRDAALGLHELLQASPTLLQRHLAVVIERGAALFVDREPTIRQAALKLYLLLTALVTHAQMEPFFNLIMAHLCCAMTHIEESIQMDALKFIDLFLDVYPQLLVKFSGELLPNFISLISKKSQGVGKNAVSLAVNPSQRIHAQKWRANVLDRLHAVLSAVANQTPESDHVASRSANHRTVEVSGRTPVHHQLISDYGFESNFRFR